jgi:glutaredoxin-like protein NrdH
MITVYVKSTGFCGPCMLTKKALENAGLDFELLAVEDQDAAVIDDFRTRIGTEAPIVITDNDAWSGFRPDRIDELAALTAA